MISEVDSAYCEGASRVLRGDGPRSEVSASAQGLSPRAGRTPRGNSESHTPRGRGFTFQDGVAGLLADLRLDGFSPATIHNNDDQLKRFGEWLAGEAIKDLRALTPEKMKELATFMATLNVEHVEQMNQDALLRYREELSWRLTPKGTPLTARSQSERLGSLRAFCRWMVEQDWLVTDPAKRIPNPRKPRRFPRSIMDAGEVERIMALPDMHTQAGYRDRVILEVLYSSALRREEAARLRLADVDTEGGYLTVRNGKNGKDRVVPVGASVCKLLDSYIAGVRADWLRADKDAHLFLNRFGYGMQPQAVWHVVKKYSQAAGIKKSVSTHTFRHTCATGMARAGAPIRHLQELLGHESIETTQLYTQLAITDLKAAHRRFHPRERDSTDA